MQVQEGGDALKEAILIHAIVIASDLTDQSDVALG
jgi:hypothetical protein